MMQRTEGQRNEAKIRKLEGRLKNLEDLMRITEPRLAGLIDSFSEEDEKQASEKDKQKWLNKNVYGSRPMQQRLKNAIIRFVKLIESSDADPGFSVYNRENQLQYSISQDDVDIILNHLKRSIIILSK